MTEARCRLPRHLAAAIEGTTPPGSDQVPRRLPGVPALDFTKGKHPDKMIFVQGAMITARAIRKLIQRTSSLVARISTLVSLISATRYVRYAKRARTPSVLFTFLNLSGFQTLPMKTMNRRSSATKMPIAGVPALKTPMVLSARRAPTGYAKPRTMDLDIALLPARAAGSVRDLGLATVHPKRRAPQKTPWSLIPARPPTPSSHRNVTKSPNPSDTAP